jgi:hypothetical protein
MEGTHNKTPYFSSSSQQIFFLEVLDLMNQNYTLFCHNCDIPKPDLIHPKSTTINNFNDCGFGMQQFWFWDVTVVAKRCVVMILESQTLKDNRSLRKTIRRSGDFL